MKEDATSFQRAHIGWDPLAPSRVSRLLALEVRQASRRLSADRLLEPPNSAVA